jgi:succinate dehydrogenase/fumarate reductase flavoprotein subunit
MEELAAPHVHELVRLRETEAMILAARLILGASLFRTESRLSHFREDHDARDDTNWAVWVDVHDRNGDAAFGKTPIPTPLCPIAALQRRPSRLRGRFAAAGT